MLALLAGWLLAAALAVAAPASAPVGELGRDWFSATLEAGYAGYAFPLAEPALARAVMADSGLAWQTAFDHSTIPVRLAINHRRGTAFRGRVEVAAPFAYPLEEDAAQRGSLTSAEFIAPPSVPTDVVLAPRACPPVAPGTPVKLTVRLYQAGVSQPLFTQEAEVIQLEPAHLYSLSLDAPSQEIVHQRINAENRLGLEPPLAGDKRAPLIAPELLASHHYILPEDHRQLTGLPLAAGQFAFVLADAEAVRTWSEAEQRALAQYLLGGGQLCLYHAAGAWLGLDLSAGAQSAGRGSLLPVAGDLAQAQSAVQHWLEGELTELVLWLGGAAQGATLDLPGPLPRLARLESLLDLYGPAQQDGEVLARRPGYLHPVLFYRETSRQDALEPWDYPEFLSASTETFFNNANLRGFDRLRQGRRFPPLAELAAAARPACGTLWLIAGLAALPALLAGFNRRRAWLFLLPGLAGTGLALHYWQAEPQIREQPLGLAVYDLAANLPGAAVARELQALQLGQRGAARLELTPGALLRHIAWQPPGDWSWHAAADGARWQGAGGGSFAAVSTTAPVAAPDLPVSLALSRGAAGRWRLTLDTSALAPEQRCFLLTPLGWQVIPGGRAQVVCEVELPQMPFAPGLERLRAIRRFLAARTAAAPNSWQTIYDRSSDLALAEAALPGGPFGPPAPAGLEQLGWAGLVQQPAGLRGVNWHEAVLIAPLPGPAPARTARFVRYSLPLEAPR